MADLTITYLTVLRSGGLVSGGSLKAVAESDGVPKIENAVLTLQVAVVGEDFVERHPFAKFAVSYRGVATGYEFLVDLAVEMGSTSINISEDKHGSLLMTTEQQRTVNDLLAAAAAATEAARLRTENLGGIRQLSVTPTYVELFDAIGTRLTPSTHVTPNGYTLETITIEGV